MQRQNVERLKTPKPMKLCAIVVSIESERKSMAFSSSVFSFFLFFFPY